MTDDKSDKPADPRDANVDVKADVLDEPKLWRNFDDDREFLAEQVDKFCRVYPPQLAAVGEALDNRDGPAAAFAAHRFAGTVTSFAALAALAAAKRLEDLARAGDLPAAAAAAADLRREAGRLERALRRLAEGGPSGR